MNTLINRLKKLEEKLYPFQMNKSIILINYLTGRSVREIIINDRNYTVPKNVNLREFINEKAQVINDNVVVCQVYLPH